MIPSLPVGFSLKEMNYKKSLNLPRTNFPMKANLAQLEPRILSEWKKTDIYRRLREERKGKTKFILHDGPPYANGFIHLGHALNKILKDIVVKFKLMQGFDTPFICGWDCHGLPVEHQLFKELKLTKHDVDILDFRRKAAKFALKFVKLQKNDFIRLGVFSDWDNPYFSLSPEYEYWVLNLLGELAAKNYIYRGLKPVNWCQVCETALAEAEVEYLDKESHSIHFLFKVNDDKGIFSSFASEVYFLAWTTTPWTLVSNVAVGVHPGLKYVLAEFKDKLIILAKDLVPSLAAKLNTELPVLREFEGKNFESIKLGHPFLDRQSLVVLAEFVSKEEGSGCVHIAPGHGEEDFSLVKKYDLPVIMPVDEKGIFTSIAPEFEGKNIEEAGESVIEKLKTNSMLLAHEKITHSYPHCWRCKKPIIFRATFQWFLDINHSGLRENLLKEIEKINWVPASGLERMKAMILNRPDWCLSRQRLWGIPIPAVKCENCQEVILDKNVITKSAGIFKDKGSNSWFSLDIENFIPSGLTCPKCKTANFSKEYDILDVWFESGASFLAVVKARAELSFPADMYLEGSDQHRGWFQASLIPCVAKENHSPFKTVLTHGFVVDGEGKKMSKSLGNVISPQEIVSQHGAEIIRLWAAYSDYTDDIKISPQILAQLVDMYRKIRNTLRFIMGNINDFDPQRDRVPLSDLSAVDEFMLFRIISVREEILNAYKEFSFYRSCQKIFNFCNIDMSSFYLDILKDRLYTYSPNSKERRSAQTVLCYILKVLIKMISPVLSFTAEEAYAMFTAQEDKKASVFFCLFEEDFLPGDKNTVISKDWGKLLDLRENVLKEIEKKREAALIGSSLEAEVCLTFPEDGYDFYKGYEDTLREIFIVSGVKIKKEDSKVVKIDVKKAEGEKCLRCWNYRDDLDRDKNYPGVCGKCLKALKDIMWDPGN